MMPVRSFSSPFLDPNQAPATSSNTSGYGLGFVSAEEGLPSVVGGFTPPTMHPKLVATLKSMISAFPSDSAEDFAAIDYDHSFTGVVGCQNNPEEDDGYEQDSKRVADKREIVTVPVDLIKNRRPFGCWCGKTFKNPQTLRMHRKTHNCISCAIGDSSSSSPLSDENRRSSSSCSVLIKNDHNHPRPRHNKKVPCRCPVCSRTFVGLYELRRHFGRKHSEGEKKLCCSKCEKRFYIDVDLRDHEKLCGEPVFCKCGLKFAFKCNLVAHKKTHPLCR